MLFELNYFRQSSLGMIIQSQTRGIGLHFEGLWCIDLKSLFLWTSLRILDRSTIRIDFRYFLFVQVAGMGSRRNTVSVLADTRDV